jgi:hypothetical protein
VPLEVTTAHLRVVLLGAEPNDRLDLGGNVDLVALPAAERLANNLLAVAGAVELGGVDEVDTALEGVEQAADRCLVVDQTPLAAELPAAEGGLADPPSGGHEPAILHRPS